MEESVSALQFTTIGDVIKQYREQAKLSISELARQSGVRKGIISKVENGDTKRPELKTVKALASVIEIPYQEIVEHYIEIEERPDVLLDLLMETIQISDDALISKITLKFLQSPRQDTYEICEQLYTFSSSITNVKVKTLLYDNIIKYSREHGVMQYLAKGLLQKYLIERMDFKRLEESYKIGEEINHYVDFLNDKEKITYYFRLALHAHNIKKYEDCIKFGNLGHAEDKTRNELKERVALAICNSYVFLGNYNALEEYLITYEKLNYTFVTERIKYYHALILTGRGNYELAIPLLWECIYEATAGNRLHRVNMLIEALFKINDFDSIGKLIESEESKFLLQENDPYKFSEFGRYFRFKGIFLIKSGLFDKAMEAYAQSIFYYGKIRDYKGIMNCTDDIYSFHFLNDKVMNLELLGKLKSVYNDINGNEKED